MKKVLLISLVLIPLTALGQNNDKLRQKADAGDTKAMIELANRYEAGYGLDVDSAKALELYRHADALGDLDAKGHLSRRMLRGWVGEGDSAACFALAKAAADGGSAYGIYRLGRCYLTGIGTPRDLKRGRELMEKAAQMGCSYAYDLMASSYLYGDQAFPHDIELAYKYLKKIPDGYDSYKYGNMARYFQMKGDTKTAVKWLRKGIEAGNVNAIINYAIFQENGIGMPRDERAALAEYRRQKERFHDDPDYKEMEANLLVSATDTTLRDYALARRLYEEIGDAAHCSNYTALGISYIYGNFTPVDSAMAYRYWLRSARKGDDRAMMMLVTYHTIAGNEDSADYYLQRAYERGNADAAGTLAERYYGVDPERSQAYAIEAADLGDEAYRVMAGRVYNEEQGDREQALACFDRAIHNAHYDAYLYKAGLFDDKRAAKLLEEGGRHGSGRCYGALGKMYELREDYRKAEKYYLMANDPQADFELASLYVNGTLDSSETTRQRGFALLQRSAAAGNRDGMYWLGYSYQRGIACEQNLDSALHYFRALADQGDGLALLQMAIACEHGRGVEPDTALAMDYYQRAGAAGVSDGYAFLGDFYRNGTSFQQPDSAAAFQYYQQACAIDDASGAGCYYMGESYLKGIGVAKDTTLALAYLRQAAARGSYMSMGLIGDYHNYGWAGLPVDGDSALVYYFEASKGDDPHGDYMIGSWLYDQDAYEQAFQYFSSAAGNGSVDAYISLAQMLMIGAGIDADPARSVGMLQQAAPADPSGKAYLLLAAANLRDEQPNTALALRYLDSSIALGNTSAMMTLGNLYAEGEQVPQDTLKTVQLYERAATQGSLRAMKLLAGSYQSGSIAPKNLKRAAELYQMAADRGDLEAICRLGLCYEEGEGVILNSRKAYNLYMQAAEQGSAYGMYLVGMCYSQGIYVNEDDAQAFQWFLRGAEAGNLRCCYFVGLMYASGDGTKKNKKEARKWLTLAAENGMEAAEQALRDL